MEKQVKLFILIFILILIQINLYAQHKDKIKISGTIKEETSKSALPNCEISIYTPSGLTYISRSDSNGYFEIENISSVDNKFVLLFKKSRFFHEELKIYFNNNANDTIINIELRMFEINVDWWIPDIYFKYNKAKPVSHYKEALDEWIKFLKANPNLIIKIIGIKDSAEAIDLRLERVNFVLMKLINSGIDNKQLKTEISNSPNFIKENTMKVDYKTGKLIKTFLTDEYINKISSVKEREKLRQLNRCVSFEIISD